VRRISAQTGTVSTVAGNGLPGGGGDGGPGVEASLVSPGGIVVGPDRSVYVSVGGSSAGFFGASTAIRRVDPSGAITRYAGLPALAGDGGPAAFAYLLGPTQIAFDATNSAYILEGGRIRKIGVDGRIRLFRDTTTSIAYPSCLGTLSDGSVLFCDTFSTISRRDPTGAESLVAGRRDGIAGAGSLATDTLLTTIGWIAVDSQDRIYLAEPSRGTVRRVDPDGTITTIAGTGVPGFSGDGGPAVNAKFRPIGIALDGDANVYIADGSNARVRKIDTEGIVTTIAGNGRLNPPVDGSIAVESPVFAVLVAVDGRKTSTSQIAVHHFIELAPQAEFINGLVRRRTSQRATEGRHDKRLQVCSELLSTRTKTSIWLTSSITASAESKARTHFQ